MSRPAELQINLSAIQSNIRLVKSLANKSKVVACIKADAYGHGAAEVAKAIDSEADLFGLACLEEVHAIQNSNLNTPSLLLEGCFEKGEWQEAHQLGCSVVIHQEEQLQQFLSLQLSSPMNVWLKLDSGMHRLGFNTEDYIKAHQKLSASTMCNSITLMSHLACSEELDNPFNDQQINTFANTTAKLSGKRSIANSAAILTRSDTHFDWVRPGYMLYGNSPMINESPQDRSLQHTMTFKSKVIAIRQIQAGEGVGYNHAWHAKENSTIAIVAAGYGDGYPRNSANGTPVLINGHKAHTVGHVAMDMLLVDISHLTSTGIDIGSQVELWGPNLSVSEVAQHSGFSGYELLTRLTARLPRQYLP